MKKKYFKLVEGQKINNWVVIENLGIRNRITHYKVKCVCGTESIKTVSQTNKTKECFLCSRKRQTENGGPRRIHGGCSNKEDLYKTYQARYYMIKRCQGKTIKDKRNYLDRGIKVCERWMESFENFLKDMGKKPENSSLDRIDNEKGYSPENCRWANIKEQNDNKRGCIYYTYKEEKFTISRWAEKWGMTRSKASEWLKTQGIDWVVENLDKIKKCKTGMSNKQYREIGFGNEKRKGHGQRKHSASRDVSHPLHKMYKSWDYMKRSEWGMCDEWNDFLKFVDDMGCKPEGKRLLRKIKSGEFCKENCYWGN